MTEEQMHELIVILEDYCCETPAATGGLYGVRLNEAYHTIAEWAGFDDTGNRLPRAFKDSNWHRIVAELEALFGNK
jgi:hypothetical protein